MAINSVPKEKALSFEFLNKEPVMGGRLSSAMNPTMPSPPGPTQMVGGSPTMDAQMREVPEQAENLDLLSKAFKSFSNALKTPGFTMALAKLGYSLAGEGTWQKTLGATAIEAVSQRSYSDYVNKLMTGQPISESDMRVLTPQQITEGRAMADTNAKLKMEQDRLELDTKSQAANQRYMEEQTAGLPKSFGEKKEAEKDIIKTEAMYRKPDVQSFIEGQKTVSGYFDPEGKWIEMGRGVIPSIQATEIRELKNKEPKKLTPGQQETLHRWTFSRIDKQLMDKYLSKNLVGIHKLEDGTVGYEWKKKGAYDEYVKELGERVRASQYYRTLGPSTLDYPVYKGPYFDDPDQAGKVPPGVANTYKTEDDLIQDIANGVIPEEEGLKIAKMKGWD